MDQAPKELGTIYWLPDEDYKKAMQQLRLQFVGMLHPLRMYGQGEYVDQAIEEAVRLSEDFGLRVRGVDKPISLELVRKEWERKERLARDGD